MTLRRIALALLALPVLAALPAAAFTPTVNDCMVQVTATATDGPPPAITLNWTTTGTPTGYTINRRIYGDASANYAYGFVTALSSTSTSFTDTGITPGTIYEYQVVRAGDTWAPAAVTGYVASGDQVPLAENRGTVDLLVDQTIASSGSCAPQLARFTQDLIGDGWTVISHNVPRDTNLLNSGSDITTSGTIVSAIRQTIMNDAQAYPNLGAVVIFGHVAIPFTGDEIPDGHYFRAMPCDGYYGDMGDNAAGSGTSALSGTWSDTILNFPVDKTHNGNPPSNLIGDGRWDVTNGDGVNYYGSPGITSRQFMVGRIDFANEPAFTTGTVGVAGVSEVQMLNQYLDKDHNFRNSRVASQRKAIYAAGGGAYVRNIARTFDAYYGASNVTNIGSSVTWGTISGTTAVPYLSAYAGCTGATDETDSANFSTEEMVAKPYKVLFCWAGASFMEEWWRNNNALRGILAMPTYGLSCGWCDGITSEVQFERFAMGIPIGASMQSALSTSGSSQYPDEPFKYSSSVAWTVAYQYDAVWESLMGDPTLSMYVVTPPTSLAASAVGGNGVLTWTPSPDSNILGYNVYRGTDLSGTTAFTRLNASLVSGTTFTDGSARSGNVIYMVRAVHYENRGTGLYQNASQGQYVSLPLSGSGSLPPTAFSLSGTTRQFTPAALTLSGSDPAGNPLFYSVVISPSNGSLSGTAPNLTYTPTANFSGSDSFSYVVNNGLADSAVATVSLTVIPGISITSPVTGNRFVAPASIPITASTDPGRTFTNVTFYNGTTQIGVAASAPYTYNWTGVGVGAYSLTATGTDSLGRVSTSTGVAIAVDSGSGTPGVAYTGTGSYTQNFNTLSGTNGTSYPWADNSTLPGWYALVNGTTPATYQGSDGTVYNGSILYSLGVNKDSNRSLGCTAYAYPVYWGVCLTNQTGSPITTFTLTYTGKEWRDQTTTNLTFAYSPAAASLTNGAFTAVPALTFVPPHTSGPSGTTYNGNLAANQATYTQTVTIPGVWDVNGKLWLRWSTGAQNGGEEGTDDVSVSTPPVPVITSTASVTGTIGYAFDYPIEATNNPTSYSAPGLPAGLSMNMMSGLISGTPSAMATGTTTVTLGATNGGGTGNAPLTITVVPPPPVITTVLGTQAVTAGQSVTLSITATGSGTLTYQWSENGMPITSATNSSYTIPDASSGDAANYTVTVTDSYGDTSTSTYTLTVNTPIPAASRWALAALVFLLFAAAIPFLRVKTEP